MRVYLASLVTEGSDTRGFEWFHDEESARGCVGEKKDVMWYVGPVDVHDYLTEYKTGPQTADEITRWINSDRVVCALWSGKPQRDEMGDVIERWTECGTCGRVWNDAIISGLTPTPSARCPFEYDHEYDD